MAKLLDGREYLREISEKEEAMAKENGLVIVFGYSDDNVEFRGAINEEVGCYDGTTVYLTEYDELLRECNDINCPHNEWERRKCRTIEVIWCPPDGGSWAYETEIPCAKFNIYREEELYCVGIVFDVDLARAN